MTKREEVVSTIKELINKSLNNIVKNNYEIVIEIPPNPEMGDLAIPLFSYSNILKKKPFEIGELLKNDIEKAPIIYETAIKGAYLNIFLNRNSIFESIITDILSNGDNFAKQPPNNIKVVLEFSSPNTNKPLHLGHCRNNVLGDFISKIYRFCGYSLTSINLINDRGIHICKSMLAYKLFGNGVTPESEGKKSDHLVGDFYVKYAAEEKNNHDLENEAKKMLTLWENNDNETIDLWKKMNDWAISGMKETYKKMGIEFDNFEYESNNYLLGKDIVMDGLNRDIFFKESDNSVWVDNSDVGLDKKALLRADGTSIYITQDLGTAKKRYDIYNATKFIYVVGSEQNYHFDTLFATLKKLGFEWAENCFHLSYGMVNLQDGKMKSREGKVIDADNLIDLLYNLAKKEIDERNKDIDEDEKKYIAEKVALSALKFYLLNFSTSKDIMFIPEKSISFDGNTGPYIQYTTSRINSLITKNGDNISNGITIYKYDSSNYKFNQDEWNVIYHLLNFEDTVIKSCENLSSVELTTYIYELSKRFNKFYHDNPILSEVENTKNIRLNISLATFQILKIGLRLLGIEPLNKM